jgi:hypothetical protein
MLSHMPPAPRRSPHDGLTASEGEELVEASRLPSRLALPVADRYREVAAEYAARCVRHLVGNDLMAALRAATIADAAERTAVAEDAFSERSRLLREAWEATNHTRPRAISARSA